MPTAKAHRQGTHRARHPAQTWQVMAPKLARFGVTRVADVTGLDTVGIPVALAIRPLARSLSVSQGKGQDLLLAKVSAVMESIELWHVEQVYPPVVAARAPAAALGLPYRVTDLDMLAGSLVTADTPLDWIAATGLVGGRTVPVPLDMVCLARPGHRGWTPPGFRRTSNGLASGNCGEEAALHALYEVIERDAIRGEPWEEPSRFIDPDSVTDPGCAALLDRLRAAGMVFDLVLVPSRFDVPCFAARVWSADLPVTCLGFGAHGAPDVALSRALTEAAQARLTTITGSREDLPSVYEQVRHGGDQPPTPVRDGLDWSVAVAGFPHCDEDLAVELAGLSARVTRAAGAEPLLVDLSTDPDFAVVKVLVPGTGTDLDRLHDPG